ncbi:hypothetical protein [Lysinibacillus fusiformis]|uniref:hypothetical protein n=1 Tax=Lysinibacillus fusiformis TaxID=28031 RepID=UPI0021C0D10F|nr:hypothetical protein [Lysinibacillus fusiformis]UXJ71390.1 hypothetical protein N5069_23495 [Lysinibacillus fusiformis]
MTEKELELSNLPYEDVQFADEVGKLINLNNPQFYFRINLDPVPTQGFQLSFDFNTNFENGVVIYYADNEKIYIPKYVQKNYTKDGTKVTHGMGFGMTSEWNSKLIVAGFHKTTEPNPNLPWYLSPVKVIKQEIAPSGHHVITFGFEDGTGWDFNAIRVTLWWE